MPGRHRPTKDLASSPLKEIGGSHPSAGLNSK